MANVTLCFSEIKAHQVFVDVKGSKAKHKCVTFYAGCRLTVVEMV